MLKRADINGHHTTSTTTSDARQRAVDAFPVATAADLEHAGWAGVAGVSVDALDAWLADPAFLRECKAAAAAALLSGSAEMPRLNKLAADLLSRIEEGVAGLDPFEAADLLKVVSRLREHRDRVRLAEADQYENLPMVIINIGLGVSTKVVPPGKLIDIVDVSAKNPTAGLADASTGTTGAGGLDAFDALSRAVPLTRTGDGK